MNSKENNKRQQKFFSNKWHELLLWLTQKEKEIANHQTPGNNFLQFEKLFYPSLKGRVIPKADKYIFWLIMFSFMVVFLEITADDKAKKLLFYINLIVTFLFVIEYSARFSIKGKFYSFSVFGILDLFCILADISIAIIYICFSDHSSFLIPIEYGYFLKILRFIRLIRFIKFLQYRSILKKKIPYAIPLFLAGARSMLLITLFLGIPLLVLYSYNPGNLLQLTLATLFNIEHLTRPDGKPSGDLAVDGLIITTVGLLFINLFAAIFTPIANRILASNREKIRRELRKDHVLIYSEKETTYLEEILYVMLHYSSHPIVFMTPNQDMLQGLSISAEIDVMEGDISYRQDCALANAREAYCILVIGSEDFNENSLFWRIRKNGDELSNYPRVIWLNENQQKTKGSHINEASLPPATTIDAEKLRRSINNSISTEKSIQFQLYRELIDFYDKTIELPKVEESEEVDFAIKEVIKDGIMENYSEQFFSYSDSILDIKLEKNSNIIRVETNDDEKNEALLIHAISKFIENTDINLSGITIFCAVNDFHLADLNEYFNTLEKASKCNTIIFAIEFCIAMAILHEIKLRGSISLWENGLSSIKVDTKLIEKTTFLSPNRIDREAKYMGYISHQSGSYIPFPDHETKIKVPEKSILFFLAPDSV